MSVDAEMLRKLAAGLREEDARRRVGKREKCARVVQAMIGLDLLRRKLGIPNG